MTHKPDIPRRRSTRLPGFDYSQAGAYFVTIVTQGRLCLFGDVVDETVRLNDAGWMAHRVWESLPQRFSSVEVDYFVVMPNHVHGVIFLHRPLLGARDRATTRVAPTGGDVPSRNEASTSRERATTRLPVRAAVFPPAMRRPVRGGPQPPRRCPYDNAPRQRTIRRGVPRGRPFPRPQPPRQHSDRHEPTARRTGQPQVVAPVSPRDDRHVSIPRLGDVVGSV